MRYITPEEFSLFDQEIHLLEERLEAEHKWRMEVEKSYKGEITYESTEPLFNEYLEAYNKWKKFLDDNRRVLLAGEIS